MNNLFYPQSPQPIPFIYLYASHMFYRVWRRLLPALIFFFLLEYIVVSGSTWFHIHQQSIWQYMGWLGYPLICTIYFFNHCLLLHIKAVTDLGQVRHFRTARKLLVRVPLLMIFDLLSLTLFLLSGLLLIIPGLYVLVAFNLRLPLYLLSDRAMFPALLDSISYIKGQWFATLFTLIFPTFILFSFGIIAMHLLPNHTFTPPWAVAAALLAKDFILMPWMACLYIVYTHHLMLRIEGVGFISETPESPLRQGSARPHTGPHADRV
jgi:hypothetical protein